MTDTDPECDFRQISTLTSASLAADWLKRVPNHNKKAKRSHIPPFANQLIVSDPSFANGVWCISSAQFPPEAPEIHRSTVLFALKTLPTKP